MIHFFYGTYYIAVTIPLLPHLSFMLRAEFLG